MDSYISDMRQSHTTVATVEKLLDGSYVLKALKQKLFVDGLCYLLQEIYGIENKNNDKVDVRSRYCPRIEIEPLYFSWPMMTQRTMVQNV